LLRPHSNEFALMNNGITILSDETNLNERIGQHNKAQLRLLRPQIINGGQTAYTLSRILSEDKLGAESQFNGKEVLTKIITLTPRNPSKNTAAERLSLIEEISVASNRQTPVNNADRASNDPMYPVIQKVLFEKCGIFYERKRGEFSDGVLAGYIERRNILERNLFLRIFLASRGDIREAGKKKIFVQHRLTLDDLTDEAALDVFADGFALFNGLNPRKASNNANNARRYRGALAKIYIGITKTDRAQPMPSRLDSVENLWAQLLRLVSSSGRKYFSRVIDGSKNRSDVFAAEKWMSSLQFEDDVRAFVKTGELSHRESYNGPGPSTLGDVDKIASSLTMDEAK
jgi:AIPR protein